MGFPTRANLVDPGGHCAVRVLGLLMLLVSLLAVDARGQQDEGWQPADNGHRLRVVGLQGARVQAITVVWPNEFRRAPNAEKALALAVAGFRLQRARASLPEGARASVEVLDISVSVTVMPGLPVFSSHTPGRKPPPAALQTVRNT